MSDPDRFFQFTTPGAQEWWYFDAISDDGRDTIVLVWYAGLPFDPDYGVAAIKHVRDPQRFPAPNALDHCAIGVSWYRDGKTVAYALNGFRAKDFHHTLEPFAIDIAGNCLARNADGYLLAVSTPVVNGRTQITSHLRFTPASGTEPLERDLGSTTGPHVWTLVAADCHVEGEISCGAATLKFRGRGYHDHNAGSEEISLGMNRWRWGRLHSGPLTHVYYHCQPQTGPESGVWITCRDGKPETVREAVKFLESPESRRNVFGIHHGQSLRITGGSSGLVDARSRCVDDGPFYRRWVGEIGVLGETGGEGANHGLGISELLDTRNLNRSLFNWMIPYRLKRPNAQIESVS